MELKELLTEDRIAIKVKAGNWEEAVRKVGQLMVDTGVVEDRYIDGMIRTTKELGPYIVIAPGLAIPHSRPEDGVIETCYAIAILESPVEFGNPDNDPVYALIALGAKDHDGHVEALQTVAEILMVPENLEALKFAGSKEEVMRIMGIS